MQGKPLTLPVLSASLLLIALAVFGNTLFYPFVHDDLVFIVQNPQISRLDKWFEVLTQPSMSGEGGLNAYYRPVLEIIYRLQYAFFGFDPAGFHLSNVLLHALNGILLFLVLMRLQFDRGMAYALSVLFLVHPVQTEAVACVAGISNLLCAAFMLAALLAYLYQRYVLAFLGMTLAFLTKEHAVVLPLLLIAVDLYRSRRAYGWWIGAFLLTAFLLYLRGYITQTHLIEDVLASPGELRLRLLAIPRTLLMYLGLIFFPSGLHYYRNTDILASNTGGFIGLILVSILLIGLLKRFTLDRRVIALGLAWFLILLLPVLNIVPLVNEYSFIMTAEHFLYLPMAGVCLALIVLVTRVLKPQDARRIFIALVIVLGALSIHQNRFWANEIALFERMSRYEPDFGRGQILLAKAYQADGQHERALECYRKALRIMEGYRTRSVNPEATRFYQGFIADLHLYIAQSLSLLDQGKAAQQHYEEALKDPLKQTFALEGMAAIALKAKDIERAIDLFKQALVLDPQNASLLNNLAIAYLEQGDKIQAEQFFKMALGVNPGYAPARQNLNRLIEELP